MKKTEKKAFTLAEVLITLTIIGVAAAITVPVLIGNQKDTALTAQYKKAYSVFSQALNTTNMLDFAGSAACFYYLNDGKLAENSASDRSGCHDFWQALVKNMNVIKTCTDNAKSGGCAPKYASYMSPSGGCGSLSENNINNRNTAFVLADGQIIILDNNINDIPAPLFLVDINGMKGPNKGGHDLFTFLIGRNNEDGSFVLKPTGCQPVSSGGRDSFNMWKHAFGGAE